MTSYTFPVDDDGTGAVVAEIRVKGDATWATLIQLIEVAGRAKKPLTIRFDPGPQPLFVDIQTIVKVLGTTLKHVRRLISDGHLTPIRWDEDRIPPYAHSEMPYGLAPHRVGPTLYPWHQVVELAGKAEERGHFPVLLANKPQRVLRLSPSECRDAGIAVLRKHASQHFTLAELRDLLDMEIQRGGLRRRVTLHDLRAGMTSAINSGYVQKFHSHGHAVFQYRAPPMLREGTNVALPHVPVEVRKWRRFVDQP